MIQVLGDRVLVVLPPEPEEIVSAGGIVLARDPDRVQLPTQGIVAKLGEKSGTVDLDDVLATIASVDEEHGRSSDGTNAYASLKAELKRLGPSPFDVQVGDCVIFPRFVGEELELDGLRYVILREAEIIGIVESKEQAA